ncbi:MAG TPA: hypothetical protein VLL76_07230 [Candidatus Omnitrophota bacterium]|nr:hypothetical protein [Candidatus Omnitrophota bacterium]
MTLRKILPFVAVASSVVLASCSVFEKKAPPPCPPVYILSDASTLTKYREGKGRDLTDVEFEAEITGYKGECKYDDKGAVVDIEVIFSLKRGPADTDRKAEFEYFVAVPLYYPSPQAKAVFPVTIPFLEGANHVKHFDEAVSMRIPVKDNDVIQKYEVYLGFQTSAEELERNRKAK